MELSVIIVSYNVRYFLEQCLISVIRASENIDCEIFVVDNNSTDGSCAMLAREFPGVKLIANDSNKGFSSANNQAIKQATGRYLLLLNPDTIVEEDTFTRCIRFMDEHPDAGALGVRMIDGKGRMLKESRRALPTPATAFFKMTGISRLFPRSPRFNRYYLGHLDDLKTTEADIISGAFMFLRSEAAEKAGPLDEQFFMYGEDVDYSYRLIKEGYKNYYYPEVKIIHYKGQSTKQEKVNTVVNFYRAMSIFVKKHFSDGNLKSFIFLLNAAIFFSAGIALMKKFIRRAILPLGDALLVYSGYGLAAFLWGSHKYGAGYYYPELFTNILIPCYTLLIIASVAFLTGYRIPARIPESIKGIIAGTVLILIVYALLPLDMRFSRAIIIIGGISALIILPVFRLIFSLLNIGLTENPFLKNKKTVIVSDSEGFRRIKSLLSSAGAKNIISGRVSINQGDTTGEVLGNLTQLNEVIRVNRTQEVIFATRNLSASQIIDSMHSVSGRNISIRIASAGEEYLLGSRYISKGKGKIPFLKTIFSR